MKKRTLKAWIGKNCNLEEDFYCNSRGLLELDEVSSRKGKKTDWFNGEWPPVKVKVTIEVVE